MAVTKPSKSLVACQKNGLLAKAAFSLYEKQTDPHCRGLHPCTPALLPVRFLPKLLFGMVAVFYRGVQKCPVATRKECSALLAAGTQRSSLHTGICDCTFSPELELVRRGGLLGKAAYRLPGGQLYHQSRRTKSICVFSILRLFIALHNLVLRPGAAGSGKRACCILFEEKLSFRRELVC
jgi:hypothetical protein